MEAEKAADFVKSDPNRSGTEHEFHVGMMKGDKELMIDCAIAGPLKRLIKHSDVDTHKISVYYGDSDSYEEMELEDFEGDGHIISGRFRGSIGLMKIGSSPRKGGGYSTIVSEQKEVNIG